LIDTSPALAEAHPALTGSGIAVPVQVVSANPDTVVGAVHGVWTLHCEHVEQASEVLSCTRICRVYTVPVGHATLPALMMQAANPAGAVPPQTEDALAAGTSQ
jgi:hypothetical protein